jgi:hypothetical protein
MEAISMWQWRFLAVARSISPTLILGCKGILQDLLFVNHGRIESRHRGRQSMRGGEIRLHYNRNCFALGTGNAKHQRTLSTTNYPSTSGKGYFSFNTKRFQALRQGISSMLFVGGFLKSSIQSLFANYRSKTYEKPLESVQLFLRTSGLDKEFAQTLNYNIGVNLALLARVQLELCESRFRLETPQPILRLEDATFWTEAKRYMRYATAVYGNAMIHAAEVEARGNFHFEHLGKLSHDIISGHIGVPPEDIHLLDIDNNGDSHHLRHFVAIDHEHKKVVLSIRGTFSPQEIMVDICAFSREFCGGEAHSGMASMSERVWEKAGPTILRLLQDHPKYEFIVTGHSLGAGTACLLTIMVQSQQLVLSPMRCFAYASPPVFAPSEMSPNLDAITNFIHQHDMSPFLCVYFIRNLLSHLQTIQSYAYRNMSRLERFQVAMGKIPPPPAMMEHFNQWKPFAEILQGAPRLEIPAAKTIWLHERSKHCYEWECLTPQDLLQHFSDIRIHPQMIKNHCAPSYEYALEHLEVEGSNGREDE